MHNPSRPLRRVCDVNCLCLFIRTSELDLWIRLMSKTASSASTGTETLHPERRIVFRNKRNLLWVLAACVVEAFLAGRTINHETSFMHDWIHIGGLLFCLWIVTMLAVRTESGKERFLFAFVSMAFALWTALVIILPSQQIVHFLRWIIFLMWISATISGIAILLGSSGPSTANPSTGTN